MKEIAFGTTTLVAALAQPRMQVAALQDDPDEGEAALCAPAKSALKKRDLAPEESICRPRQAPWLFECQLLPHRFVCSVQQPMANFMKEWTLPLLCAGTYFCIAPCAHTNPLRLSIMLPSAATVSKSDASTQFPQKARLRLKTLLLKSLKSKQKWLHQRLSKLSSNALLLLQLKVKS